MIQHITKSLLFIGIFVLASAVVAEETALNGRKFTLAEGLQLELVAGPPLIDRPICADFDEQGRLYVAESSGSNDKVEKQLQEKPHRIVRLEDADGDGRFDRRTIFADKMMFPEGTLWHDGSLYVAAPPSIWKLTDSDGDGVADHREEWFKGKTLTGCANDLHGPYLGPDGWMYWCKGAFAEQTYPRPGKPPLVTRAAHIFRRHPTTGSIEPVMTGGMANPVEVVFTPGGERIFTTTFLQQPAGGRRDGLIHAVYGGVYGKEHGVLDGHPRTGELMPVLTHLGAAAPCGLARLETTQLGDSYRNNLLVCSFNMHKVTQHRLVEQGAAWTTEVHDLLVCENIDFHPTDVLEDADGSVLVIDTGGWYKLCCPTSQLWKPDVLGGIYRIRRKGAVSPYDPRGLRLAWSKLSAEKLVDLLDDDRPAVRKRAISSLAAKRESAVNVLSKALQTTSSKETRLNAVWALTRIDHVTARAAVRKALNDQADTVRRAAFHSISLWRDGQALEQLIKHLQSPSPFDKRLAAESLGRIGNARAIDSLLATADVQHDRTLEHALIYALIEIANPRATAIGLRSQNPAVRKTTLIALDQMPSGGLSAEQTAPLLASSEPLLRETATWIADRHPEWAPQLVGVFKQQIARQDLSPDKRSQLQRQLARFAHHASVQQLLADTLNETTAPTQMTVLNAMASAGLKEIPKPWSTALVRILRHEAAPEDAELLQAAASAAHSMSLQPDWSAPLVQSLLAVAGNPQLPDELRLTTLAAAGPGKTLPDEVFAFVLSQLSEDAPVRRRLMAAEILVSARLNATQQTAVAQSLEHAGPMEFARLLSVFEKQNDEKLGRQVLASLRKSSVAASLPVETFKKNFAKFGPSIQKELNQFYQLLDRTHQVKQQQLESMLAAIQNGAPGDVHRGHEVFRSSKAACAACHPFGYLGGRIGPDLTRIGGIRTERDLLEAILFPNASFVRSYEPVTVLTNDGKTYSGVLQDDAATEISLVLAADKTVRIPREEIEEMLPGKVSIMPAGMDKQLSLQQLADLIAFLKASK